DLVAVPDGACRVAIRLWGRKSAEAPWRLSRGRGVLHTRRNPRFYRLRTWIPRWDGWHLDPSAAISSRELLRVLAALLFTVLVAWRGAGLRLSRIQAGHRGAS